jgi:formylglycine-generating enzyme required for sulfatase activity
LDPRALAPVDAHPAGKSEEGVFDMTGNSWEWCADWFAADAYATAPGKDPRGPERGTARVIRGGFDGAREGSGSGVHRGFLRPDVAHAHVGFRCAKDATAR